MKKLPLLLCALCLWACDPKNPLGPNKDNPTEHKLAACAFQVGVQDCERGFSRDSSYVFEGEYRDGSFYFGIDRSDEMVLNVTPDNRIVLKVSSEEAGFEGVNAASSSRCINIVPDGTGHTAYHLERVDEGESTITLWNGEGAGRQEVSFRVTSHEEIPLEGIAFRYDGRVYRFQKQVPTEHLTEGTFQYMFLKKWDGKPEKFDQLPVFELIGPIPLNATPTLLYLSQDFTANVPSKDDPSYGKEVSTYEYNTKLYNDYRWFWEYFLPPLPEGYNEQNWETCPLSLQEKWQYDYLNSMLKVCPSDLRERRIKLWIDSKSAFRTGSFAIYLLSGDCYVEVNTDSNSAALLSSSLFQVALSGRK